MAYPNSLSEIKNEVLVTLGVSTSVAFYTDTILTDWIDQAHKWAAGLKKWPFTEGRASTTYASLVTNEDGDLVGEYFEGWKNDSIRYLTIGGKRLQKTQFNKFRTFREERADNDDRLFSDFGRLYLINPNIDVSGTVTAWGQYTPANLDATNPDATTVFSSTQNGNEALVEKVVSYALHRQKKFQEARAHHDQAVEILNGVWQAWKDEQFGYHDVSSDEGMFKRIDYATGLGVSEVNNRDRFY